MNDINKESLALTETAYSIAYDIPNAPNSQERMALLKDLMYQEDIRAALVFDSSELQNFRNP